TFINQGQAPTTRAKNCAAAGIPAGFLSNVVNATAAGITSGNQQLTSETADSKAFGVVLRPRFIARFNVAVDYIEINLTNAIQVLNLTNILDACYDSPNYPNEPSCSLFTRNAQDQITSFTDGFRNAALLDFQGVTFGMDWNTTLPRGLGALELRANWVNTTLGYELSRAFEMRLIVNNVGNKEPPFPGLAGIGGNFESPTSLYWSGILGRNYLLSVAYHF